LIRAKQAGKAAPTVAEPKQSNVINLMDALRRSAKAERSAPASKRKTTAHRKKAAPRRKVKKAG
jgi:non-homologous end joining protein Ku